VPARKILTMPHPSLQMSAAPVGTIGLDIIEVCQDLVDTLRAEEQLLALSAPQVGVDARIIVVDLKGRPGARLTAGPLIIVDPEVAASDGEVTSFETCASLPGERFEVARPDRIFLRGLTIQGTPVGAETSGLEARLIQHAIDHLEGRLVARTAH